MDSLEGINSIPVPAQNYNTGIDTQDYIYYILQRKATFHKKNGNMDLAIACLRKSNELSDYEEWPPLLEKDYLRLVKYINLTGDTELAKKEENAIYARHPEFKDARILNKKIINRHLNQTHFDCVYITTNKKCEICSKYNRKVFSISGKNKKYPKLPSEFITDGGFCKSCGIGISSYSDEINAPVPANNNNDHRQNTPKSALSSTVIFMIIICIIIILTFIFVNSY